MFTLGGATTVASGLAIPAGTLASGVNTLTVTGALNITDTLDLTGSSNTATFPHPFTITGATTINTGGNFKTGNNSMYLSGGLVLNGGTFDFSGATSTANTTVDIGPTGISAPTTASFLVGGAGTIRPQGNVNLTNITFTPAATRLTVCRHRKLLSEQPAGSEYPSGKLQRQPAKSGRDNGDRQPDHYRQHDRRQRRHFHREKRVEP